MTTKPTVLLVYGDAVSEPVVITSDPDVVDVLEVDLRTFDTADIEAPAWEEEKARQVAGELQRKGVEPGSRIYRYLSDEINDFLEGVDSEFTFDAAFAEAKKGSLHTNVGELVEVD